jgi:hypothetical protein
VAIATQTQQYQIKARSSRAKKKAEILFIILGSLLNRQFSTDAVDIFTRNGDGPEQGFICHVVIAIIVISRKATFISAK